MRVDHVGAALLGHRHRGPILGLEIVGHHGQPREFPEQAHPALGDPAVGEVGREIHRKPDDVHSIEGLGGGQRPSPRRHDRDPVSAPHEMPVDIVNVRGLRVGRVLRVPVGGTDDLQRRSRPPG